MGAVRRLFCRLVNAFRPGDREPDFAREIRSHLALLEDEFRRRGMSDEEARLAARRAFGGIERAKDLHRDARSFRWIDDGARDLRHAVRLLRRDPLFAPTAALSLAVGIGANTATFTLANRGTSVDPGFDARGVELATVDLEQAGYTTTTGPIFVRELMDRLRDLEDAQSVTIASDVPGGFEVRREVVEDRSVDWTIVEPGYFSTLRISLTSGRDFSALDRAGTQPVAIVSHAAAQQLWQGQDAIGKYLRHRTGEGAATERPLLVVGVARDVQSTTVMDGASRPSVYVPLEQHYVPNLTIVGRTLHGRRIVNQIRAVLKSLDPNLPLVSSETLDQSVALGLMPQRVVAATAGGLGLIGLLLAGFGVYGVTACAVSRQTREIGIRIALGAGRSHVVRMVLLQGLWLTLVGAAVGVMPAAAASHVLSAFLFGIPAIDPVTFIGTILLFAAIGVAACYVPVQRATQIDPVEALRRE